MFPANGFPDSQKIALIRLGRLAVDHPGLPELLHQAAVIVAEALGVDFCKILELLPGGEHLVLRAGVGWREGLVGQALVRAGSETHAGHTLLTRAPVIVEDLRAQALFPGSSLLHDHGVTSGVSVLIPGAEPFGVLAVHTSARRSFSTGELEFLQEVCEILGRAAHHSRIQEAIRQSEERFRRTFEDSPIGIRIGSLDHGYLRANRAACELLGYSEEEFKQLTFDQITHPDDLARTRELAGRLFRGEIQRFQLEKRELTRSGEAVWVRLTATLIHDEQGNPLHTVTMVEDISAQRSAEEHLNASQERFRALIESSLDLVTALDASGTVRYVSPSIEQVLGYRPEERIGKSTFELIHPGDQPEVKEAFLRGVKTPNAAASLTFRIRHKDGSWRYLEAAAHNLLDNPAIAGVVVHSRDVTRRKEYEEALRASEAALRRNRRELRALAERLLGGEEEERRRVARELHDDLGQRLMVVAFELERLDQAGSEEVPLSLREKLHAALGRVADLSNDIRRLAHRLHPAAIELLGVPVALRQLCEEASLLGRMEVRFAARKPPASVPKELALCLYRITQESLRNAARHARADKVLVTLSGIPGGLRLSIRDNGTGFDPASTEASPGLGLISMRERARIAGGHLSVKSRPGKGTQIVVKVPLPGNEPGKPDAG